MFIVEYKYIKLQSKMQNVASAFYTKLHDLMERVAFPSSWHSSRGYNY